MEFDIYRKDRKGIGKKMYRDDTKIIKIGDRVIGGGNPILIQSMTNTPTEDVEATVKQILELEEEGCDIIRCTVPKPETAAAIAEIKKRIHIPLVADIHFDHRCALEAIRNGADKIRINPGNIGGEEKLKEVVAAAKERGIPIRVGVNSGSLEAALVDKYHGVTAEGIVESALDKVRMIEECDYDRIVISIKSSDVLMCVRAPVGVVNLTDREVCIGRGLAALTPKADVPTKFLLHLLRYHQAAVEQMATGSTFASITTDQLKNLEIPIPDKRCWLRIAGVMRMRT